MEASKHNLCLKQEAWYVPSQSMNICEFEVVEKVSAAICRQLEH